MDFNSGWFFTIGGEPKAVQSVKVSFFHGKPVFRQQADVAHWKSMVRVAVCEQLRRNYPDFHLILDKPLQVSVTYRFPPIKSFRKSEREAVSNGRLMFKTSRPDVSDNLNKGLFDALTGVIWKDDALVSQINARKVYATDAGIDIYVNYLPVYAD